jgi:orotidine-5'-phosphate decarboxylase
VSSTGSRAPSERIILALDVSRPEEAISWARRFSGRIGAFKIGLQLFTAAGPDLVARIISEHGPVFLDLKLHDIPNTVAAAVREARKLGVSMLTVHALGGTAMLRAASEAATAPPAETPDPLKGESRPGTQGESLHGGFAARPLVLAVTVLTSLSDRDLGDLGIARDARGEVLELAEMAWVAGCDGVVASPLETAAIRAKLGAGAVIVTPGIRSEKDDKGDQQRTATPRAAVDSGADYLVIGRPVLAASDPDAALDRIVRSLE